MDHKKGRPTIREQTRMKDTLRYYYENGFSALYTAQKTQFDIKTVYKYFNELSDEIEKAENTDFLERQKRDRVQTIVSYDFQLIEAIDTLKQISFEIEKFLKEKKNTPKSLLSLKLDAMRFRSFLVERKTAFIMQPTMDEALNKRIEEKIEEHAKSRESN